MPSRLISLSIPSELRLLASGLASLGLAVMLAALPFFFSGVVVAVALTETPLPTGRVYGVDLVGAALGCLAAVGFLAWLDPSTICLLLGVFAGAAAVAFCVASSRGRGSPSRCQSRWQSWLPPTVRAIRT